MTELEKILARPQTEAVNHPAHYNAGKIEVIDAIEAWSTGWPPSITFHLGNAIKYVARAGKKDAAIQDLKKAVWYLERSITSLEGRPDDKNKQGR